MLRDTAVVQMLKQCGQRQNDSAARDDAIVEFVNTQNRLERGKVQPWWLLQLYTNGSFVTGQGSDTVALPTGFLREVDDSVTDVGSLWYYDDGTWRIIYKEDYAIAQRKYGNKTPSRPERYCLLGNNIMLFPAADKVYTLRLLAAFADVSLAGPYGDSGTNVENNWLKYAPDAIIGESGVFMCTGYFRDKEGAQHFGIMATAAIDRISAETVARIEAGMLRAMGV